MLAVGAGHIVVCDDVDDFSDTLCGKQFVVRQIRRPGIDFVFEVPFAVFVFGVLISVFVAVVIDFGPVVFLFELLNDTQDAVEVPVALKSEFEGVIACA